MTAYFYESEIEENLIILIKKNYNLTKNEIIYMVIRFMLIHNIKDFKLIDKTLFAEFLLQENNLPKNFLYKGVHINESIIINIVNNWFFDLLKNNSIDSLNISFIENTVQNILKESISNNTKFKKESFYNDAVCLDSLKMLNEQFNVKFDSFFKMENVSYDLNHNDLERFREEKLDLTLKAFKEFDSNPFSLISEHDLEEFLKCNLDLIEPNLKLISTQYKIKDAAIDILAEDKNNKKVIIELKIKPNDTRLVWQTIYYPLELKKELNLNDVRMFVIAPSLDDSIKICLNGVEYFEYEISISNGKINDIFFKKFIL